MKMNYRTLLILLCLLPIFFLGGCKSKVVPPGNVIIVLQADGDSNIYTEGSYMAWGRDRVYFVDTRLKSFAERMEILCVDNINMTVDVKWIGSFSATKDNIKIIKEKVPSQMVDSGDVKGYQLSLAQFYKTTMRDIIRANTRTIVAKYSTDDVRENREEIEKQIKKRVIARFVALGYPVNSTDVMLAGLDYPEEITAQRKAIKNAQLEDEKQAALAKAAIEQAKREAGIARERGKAQIERAKADAIANNIRAKSLTTEIIQMRQWDVLADLAGQEGDMMIVPYEALGKTFEPAAIKQLLQ